MSDEHYEGIRHTRKSGKPTYIMVPRKLIFTWIATSVCLAILSVAAIQWANFVDRRSNQRWCGIVTVMNETYKENPPPTEIEKILSVEFLLLRDEFNCKKT